MRAFIAIPLSAEIRAKLKSFYDATGAAKGVKSVPLENLHITLDFLGEISEKEKDTLLPALDAAANAAKPFSLAIEGTGAFPKTAAPKTLWLGVEKKDELFALARGVKTAVNSQDTKPFSPHLTISRVKFPDESQTEYFKSFFAYRHFSFGTLTVGSFFLMKSDLAGKTPVYTKIKEFKIKDGEIKDGKR
jgi:2'-5' RNA ligase